MRKRKIAELAVDPANVRVHSERNLAAIRGSLARFGQTKPIVIDAKGVVLAGNGTLEAARALGWTEILAVETTLSGVEAAAYAIADNRTAELAAWDEDALASILSTMPEDLQQLLDFDGRDVPVGGASPSGEFPDATDPHTNRQCPQCGFRWSDGEG